MLFIFSAYYFHLPLVYLKKYIVGYFEEGFLELQYYLTVALLLERHGISNKADKTVVQSWMIKQKFPAVTMQRFPHSKWLEDRSLNIIAAVLPYILWFSFMYAYGHIVDELVLEKEQQLKVSINCYRLWHSFQRQ